MEAFRQLACPAQHEEGLLCDKVMLCWIVSSRVLQLERCPFTCRARVVTMLVQLGLLDCWPEATAVGLIVCVDNAVMLGYTAAAHSTGICKEFGTLLAAALLHPARLRSAEGCTWPCRHR